jgi:transposase-like protein
MSNERKHHAPEEKVAILRRHLIDRVPVSTLCDEQHVHPTLFYRWLKQFFEEVARPCTPRSAAFAPASCGTARNLPTVHTASAISSFMTVYLVHAKSHGAARAGPRYDAGNADLEVGAMM